MGKFSLDAKVIIVTGAAGLIGRGFCRAIAESGGITVICDINRKEGMNLEKQINMEYGRQAAQFYYTDITNLNSVRRLTGFVLDEFNRIDALVNNAYPRNKNFGKKFHDVSYKDFCENINAHLGGYFLITQQISRIMMKQNYGNIINMASIYGFTAPRFAIYDETNMTMPVEYAAIKGAIVNITRYLASYLGKHNIRVNAISPGGVFNKQPKKFVEKYSQKVLCGKRMADTNDLTGALIFLLSDASRYITGQNIVIDGGWTL